jgi:hypothetical protein
LLSYECFFLLDHQAEKKIGISNLGLDFRAVVWMRMTSNRELARQIGVSETAVRRAEKAGAHWQG